MAICRQYFQPKTIQEAIAILKQWNGEARILAGGTDLVIDLKTGKKKVLALVDISQIDGLNEIRLAEGRLCLGAMVTHAQASRSDLIRRWAPVLSEACSSVGSAQIRNMGTLVGNVVNAMPAADGASALIVLEARVKAVDWDNQERSIPIGSLYKGPGESVIDSTREIVKEVEFHIPESPSGSSFQRLSRRKALSLPILNAAALVRLDKAVTVFEEARLVVGPVSPVPFRPRRAERLLLDSEITDPVIQEAARAASDESSPRTSLRAGGQYRKEMIKVLVERAICQALVRTHPKFLGFSKESH